MKSKFLRQLGFFFSGQVFGQVVNFIFQPLILFYLLPREFGYWSLFLVVFNILKPLTGLMAHHGIMRSFFQQNESERREAIISLLGFYILFSCVVIGVLLLIIPSSWRLSYFNKNELVYFFILAFLVNFYTLAKTVIQLKKKIFWLSFLETLQAIIFYAGCFVLVKYYDYCWQAYIYSLMVSVIIVNILAYISLMRWRLLGRISFGKPLKKLLQLSLPLIPYGISGFVIAISDRFIIDYYFSLNEVGIYSLGYSVGSLVILLGFSFYNVWNPYVLEELSLDNIKKNKLVKVIYLYFFILFFLAILFYIIGYFYIKWFIPSGYVASIEILGWATLASFFYCLSFVMRPFLEYLKCSFYLSIITGVAMVCNVFLTLWAVKINGMVGAVQATVVSYLIISIGMFIYMQRHFPLPWFGKRL